MILWSPFSGRLLPEKETLGSNNLSFGFVCAWKGHVSVLLRWPLLIVTTVLLFQGVALTADTKVQRMPSESAAQSLAVALPASQSRY